MKSWDAELLEQLQGAEQWVCKQQEMVRRKDELLLEQQRVLKEKQKQLELALDQKQFAEKQYRQLLELLSEFTDTAGLKSNEEVLAALRQYKENQVLATPVEALTLPRVKDLYLRRDDNTVLQVWELHGATDPAPIICYNLQGMAVAFSLQRWHSAWQGAPLFKQIGYAC